MAKATKTAAKADTGSIGLKFTGEVLRLPVNEVRVNPLWNLTRPEGVGDVEALIDSIVASGQQVPAYVARAQDGTIELVAGNRRHEAIRLAHARGLHDGFIDCRVIADASPIGRIVANLVENEDPGRAGISWLGRLAGYEALAASGLMVKDIAALVGRAEDVIRDVLRLPKADPRLRAALEADALGEPVDVDVGGKTVAQVAVPWGIVRLIARKPKGEQGEWIKRLAGLSVAKATAALAAGLPTDEADEADEGGEGREGGEGGEGGGDDMAANGGMAATAALRAAVADRLVPALTGVDAALADAGAALVKGDAKAAQAAIAKARKLVAATGQHVRQLAGDAEIDRVKAAAEAEAERAAKAAKAAKAADARKLEQAEAERAAKAEKAEKAAAK